MIARQRRQNCARRAGSICDCSSFDLLWLSGSSGQHESRSPIASQKSRSCVGAAPAPAVRRRPPQSRQVFRLVQRARATPGGFIAAPSPGPDPGSATTGTETGRDAAGAWHPCRLRCVERCLCGAQAAADAAGRMLCTMARRVLRSRAAEAPTSGFSDSRNSCSCSLR